MGVCNKAIFAYGFLFAIDIVMRATLFILFIVFRVQLRLFDFPWTEIEMLLQEALQCH